MHLRAVRTLGLTVVIASLGGCATETTSERSGAESARRVSALREANFKRWGWRSWDAVAADKWLTVHYGWQFEGVAGCLIGGEEEEQARAYNAELDRLMDDRYGVGYVATAQRAARAASAVRSAGLSGGVSEAGSR